MLAEKNVKFLPGYLILKQKIPAVLQSEIASLNNFCGLWLPWGKYPKVTKVIAQNIFFGFFFSQMLQNAFLG